MSAVANAALRKCVYRRATLEDGICRAKARRYVELSGFKQANLFSKRNTSSDAVTQGSEGSIMEPQELQEVAIVIRPEKDNVAVVTADIIEKDTPLKHDGNVVTVLG